MTVNPEPTPGGSPADSGPSARRTPYELVFAAGGFEDVIFPRIAAEAQAREANLRDPERFSFMSTAADVIREMMPEDAVADALDQYRAMVFQAFNFWSHGLQLFVLERAVARFIVEAAPRLDGWGFATPAFAGYVQLPANLFWSSITPDTTPEPVDGFFFTVGGGDADTREVAPGDTSTPTLHLLLILGIRRDRAGFSVIPIDEQVGPDGAATAPERPDGDFTNVLPGGEIDGLYSILTADEVRKLALRAFWYIDQYPDSVVDVVAVEGERTEREPLNTRLPHQTVHLRSDRPPADGDAGG